jgi:hypothetical protein
MKRLLSIFTLLVVCASSVAAGTTGLTGPPGDEPDRIEAPANPAAMTAADWQVYCDRLEAALASKNEGLRQGALRMVIQYGHYMDFGRLAVFDAVRLYRDHADDRIRRMAVVALLQMNDSWAFDFLERSVPFEKDQTIKRTILAVLAARPSEVPAEARTSSF